MRHSCLAKAGTKTEELWPESPELRASAPGEQYLKSVSACRGTRRLVQHPSCRVKHGEGATSARKNNSRAQGRALVVGGGAEDGSSAAGVEDKVAVLHEVLAVQYKVLSRSLNMQRQGLHSQVGCASTRQQSLTITFTHHSTHSGKPSRQGLVLAT